MGDPERNVSKLISDLKTCVDDVERSNDIFEALRKILATLADVTTPNMKKTLASLTKIKMPNATLEAERKELLKSLSRLSSNPSKIAEMEAKDEKKAKKLVKKGKDEAAPLETEETAEERKARNVAKKAKNDADDSQPKRNAEGQIKFSDHPEFTPNLSPKEILQLGSFGGTYFRKIKSSVTGETYLGAWKELPADWLEGLDVNTQVSSSTYRNSVNRYNAKCGGDLEMWESSGWISHFDPYGWFQWYCRFYQGRRTEDDERQISRALGVMGPKGRWRRNLVNKCLAAGKPLDQVVDDAKISPVVRQLLQVGRHVCPSVYCSPLITHFDLVSYCFFCYVFVLPLQHWGYTLTIKDLVKAGKK